MLAAEGYPDRLGALLKVATFAQIHTNVLRRWWKATQNPPPPQLVIQKKEAIERRLEAVIHQILDFLPDALEVASTHELIIGLGVTVDKYQLLRGEPTARQDVTVHDELSDTERLARLTEVYDAARARRNGRPADEAGYLQ